MTATFSWEVLLFVLPPLVRFFMGFFLILVFAGAAVFFMYWVGKGEEEGE